MWSAVHLGHNHSITPPHCVIHCINLWINSQYIHTDMDGLCNQHVLPTILIKILLEDNVSGENLAFRLSCLSVNLLPFILNR